MKKNLSSTDKLIRLLIAIIIIALFYSEVLTGTIGIIALVLALVLAITSLVSFCPIYALLGISTCKKEEIKQ
ncbi:MAG: DUF2892 domain-containing protein [Paludibacter sp.]|nr:DUF2892 domain-containing protein [Paludibacter sp.]